MDKVEYRGEKISEKRAKGLLVLLKTGLYFPQLSEEESEEYSVWKTHYEKRDSGGLSSRLGKKTY